MRKRPGPKPTPVRDRFQDKYEVNESGCWIWVACLDVKGYGRVSVGGRMKLAHRVSYALHIGPIPEGLTLDHLCRVPRCVNPAHLEPVTHAENMHRGERARKTHCKKGRPFDEANTYFGVGDRRECRACHRDSSARRRGRRMAETASLEAVSPTGEMVV